MKVHSRRAWELGTIAGILIASLLLRMLNLSHGQSFHPDERHIVMTVTGMSWENLNPKTFAYGSLPFYLMFLVGKGLTSVWEGAFSYDGLFLVGRGISVFFGVLGVWLTYLLGRKLSGRESVGLIAAVLLAVNPFHIQLSRYATVDVILTTFNLAALLGCAQIVASKGKKGLWSGVLLTASMTGLSLSTKISSLSLALPILLSLWLGFGPSQFWRRKGFWIAIIAIPALALLVSLITQPFAVLDFETFRAHTTEQVNMVRGLWRPPYTVQYENTTPYLYHLQQMFQYTIGAPVFLAVVFGLLIVGSDLVKRFDARWVVMLAWAFAVFVIVGRYQVKFPRYFLPLYPILCVFAGFALVRASDWCKANRMRGWAALPGSLVLLLATLSGLAFVQIYRQPHAYEQASRWIFDNIPRESKLLGVHWDDKLPLTLPGLSPHEYRYRYETIQDELPVYEPDSAQKLRTITERMSDTDYLIFPTPRTYGSLLRVQDEFPQTTRMFQLLFGNELGFHLISSFKVRPSLFGRTLNDDLADESFYVYDHPKILVFENLEHLSASEIQRRIESPLPPREELPNRSAIVLAEAWVEVSGLALEPAEWSEQLRSVVVWYLLIQLLSLLSVPVIASIFSKAPDRGYAASKALGLPLWGFFLWGLGVFAGYPLSTSTVTVVTVALAVLVAQWIRFRWAFIARLFGRHLREIIWVEAIFGGAFLLLLLARAFNPEIFWGEKPMDFTFLNFFSRLESLPPDDPWFYRPGDGRGMGYYYLGFFYYGQLLKLGGIAGGVGYNLGLATVGAMAITATYGTVLWIVRSRVLALFGAALLVLCSNLDVLYLWLIEGRAANFDLFWASSRMMTSPSITEYPLWSLIFADFHPHVMALPVTVALIGMAVAPLVKVVEKRVVPLAAAFTAVVWGMLLGLNSWDAIVFGLLIALAAVVWLLQMLASGEVRRAGISRWILGLVAFAVVASVLVAAFSSTSHEGIEVNWGYVYSNEFNTVGQVLRHLGIWLFPIAFCVLVLVVDERSLRSLGALIISSVTCAVVVGGAVACSYLKGVEDQPWGVIGIAAALVFMGALFLCGVLLHTARSVGGGQDSYLEKMLGADPLSFVRDAKLVAGLLLLFSGVVVLGAELFFLMDRMNTIFKFYLPLWSFLAIATVCLLSEVGRLKSSKIWVRWGTRGFVGVVITLGFAGTLLNAIVMIPFARVSGPRPTLDGSAYLERLDGDEARMARYLGSTVKGTEPIIEAWGNSYGEFTRVSMQTGLPTVLGWEHHVYQRGAPRREIEERKRDLREIYSTRDVARVRAIAKKYGASLIVVGNVERRAFQRSPGIVFTPEGVEGLTVVKEFGPVAVVRVG